MLLEGHMANFVLIGHEWRSFDIVRKAMIEEINKIIPKPRPRLRWEGNLNKYAHLLN